MTLMVKNGDVMVGRCEVGNDREKLLWCHMDDWLVLWHKPVVVLVLVDDDDDADAAVERKEWWKKEGEALLQSEKLCKQFILN